MKKILEVLSLPVAIMNNHLAKYVNWLTIILGLVGAILVVVVDDWNLLFMGIAFIIANRMIIILLLLITVKLDSYANLLKERGNNAHYFIGYLSFFILAALFVANCGFNFFMAYLSCDFVIDISFTPLFFWFYFCAMMPWIIFEIIDKKYEIIRLYTFFTSLLFLLFNIGFIVDKVVGIVIACISFIVLFVVTPIRIFKLKNYYEVIPTI